MAAAMTSITTMPSSSFHGRPAIEGLDNFREWRDQYPMEVTVRIRRIVGSGDVWVGELSASYDGGPWTLGISVHEFRGRLIARARIRPSHGPPRSGARLGACYPRRVTSAWSVNRGSWATQ